MSSALLRPSHVSQSPSHSPNDSNPRSMDSLGHPHAQTQTCAPASPHRSRVKVLEFHLLKAIEQLPSLSTTRSPLVLAVFLCIAYRVCCQPCIDLVSINWLDSSYTYSREPPVPSVRSLGMCRPRCKMARNAESSARWAPVLVSAQHEPHGRVTNSGYTCLVSSFSGWLM